jgi:hypothetical protein
MQLTRFRKKGKPTEATEKEMQRVRTAKHMEVRDSEHK